MALRFTVASMRLAALDLRVAGMTYTEIGTSLGIPRETAYRYTRPSATTAARVVERAGSACESCERVLTRDRNIHHRQAEGMTPETYNADDNLVLLCRACHRKAHTSLSTLRRRAAPGTPGQKNGAAHLGIPVEEYLAELEAGNKWCSGHKAWEPAERFSPGQYQCRTGGSVSAKAHRQRNPEHYRAYMREYMKQRYWRRKHAATEQRIEHGDDGEAA